MSPELLDPEIQDHLRTIYSDCYALGMVIYEVLSERMPFHQCRNLVISWKVLKGDRPERPQGTEGVWFSDDVWEVLGRCWMPLPGDRPSIEDLLQCLEKVSRSWAPPTAPPIAGSLTLESSDVISVESTDASGISPLSQTAPHQPSVKSDPEGAIETVNGVGWACLPRSSGIDSTCTFRLHRMIIHCFVQIIHPLRRVC